MCTDRSTIQFMLMPSFICSGLAGLTLNPIPDRWGCKKTLRTFMTLHLLAQAAIILVPNYWVRMLGVCVMGFSYLKNASSFMYMGGIIRANRSSIVSGFINSFDTATVFLMGFYFKYVSNEWFWLLAGQWIVGVVCWSFLCFVAPESPRWLITSGQRQRGIVALN